MFATQMLYREITCQNRNQFESQFHGITTRIPSSSRLPGRKWHDSIAIKQAIYELYNQKAFAVEKNTSHLTFGILLHFQTFSLLMLYQLAQTAIISPILKKYWVTHLHHCLTSRMLLPSPSEHNCINGGKRPFTWCKKN